MPVFSTVFHVHGPALSFKMWCCDRHNQPGFTLDRFFKGKLLYQDTETLDLFYGHSNDPQRSKIIPPRKEKRKASEKTRPTKERPGLVSCLLAWRADEHKTDLLAAVRPPSFIIDDKGIKTLAAINPSTLKNPKQIVDTLHETEEWDKEWSKKILAMIKDYNNKLISERKLKISQKKAQEKRQRTERDQNMFEKETQENEARIRAATALHLQQSAAFNSSRFANTDSTSRQQSQSKPKK